MKQDKDFELFVPKSEENKHLATLDKSYLDVSEMTTQERQFLNGIIRRTKPVKMLELGVSAGSSSVIMLNAIKDNPKAKLYSIDYSKGYYMDKSKLTGFIVDDYPKLSKDWKLYTGGLALEFMEEIGGGIDFCFIDTVHSNPGELLDILMVLPYLKDECIVVFHDVNLHTFKQKVNYDIYRTYTNNLLMSALRGHKYIQGNFDWQNDPRTYFPNMGGVKLSQDIRSHVWEIFNLLTIKWSYLPSQEEEQQLLSFMGQHYDQSFVDYMQQVFVFQRQAKEFHPTSPTYFAKMLAKQILGAERISKIRARRQTA